MIFLKLSGYFSAENVQFCIADKSATYLRKRVFALFHNVCTWNFTNEHWNKMGECSSLFVFVSMHEIHPSGVSFHYPHSWESKPQTEDEAR